MRTYKIFVLLLLLSVFICGCAVVFQKGRRSDSERIQTLEEELDHLKYTKGILQERLAEEIKDKQVRLSMEEKGLVVTFVAEILFDSGKAKLKEKSLASLEKVAHILRDEVPQNFISVEGHTDNQPITYSPWKSNWELSAHRALSVLHYFEDNGISPQKISATGFGEYSPVESNDTPEGRQLNRRVEIVIVPIHQKRVRSKSSPGYRGEKDPSFVEEELK